MIPLVPQSIDSSEVAKFSSLLLEQFGPRALDIACEQADASKGDVSASWRAIAAHITAQANATTPSDFLPPAAII